MTFKELKKQIKEEQKELARKIRRGKHLRKPDNRVDLTKEDKELYLTNYYKTVYYDDFKVRSLCRNYRHKHIAYCHFFNNTMYSLIENPRSDNKRNQDIIDHYIEGWKKELDEDVCLCA